MRILLVCAFPYESATANAILNGLGAGYAAQGHDVSAAAIHFDRWELLPRCRGRERRPWGTVECLGARLKGDAWDRAVRGGLSRLAERRDFAHVHHFFGRLGRAGAAAWSACRAERIPFGATFQDYANPYWPGDRSPYRLPLLEAFLAEASWVTALSRRQAGLLAGEIPSLAGRVRVIPNGFDPVEPAGRGRRAGGGPPYVLCAARLKAYKGIDVLLRAWRSASAGREEVELAICGDGSERGRLERQSRRLGISGRVKFLGEISREALWPKIQGSLFTVLPSRHEAFGMFAVESMACGRAIVSTRSGGPQDIIRHGATGLLAAPGEPASLASAMRRLLDDARLRARLGRLGARAARSYRWSRVGNLYLRLMRKTA